MALQTITLLLFENLSLTLLQMIQVVIPLELELILLEFMQGINQLLKLSSCKYHNLSAGILDLLTISLRSLLILKTGTNKSLSKDSMSLPPKKLPAVQQRHKIKCEILYNVIKEASKLMLLNLKYDLTLWWLLMNLNYPSVLTTTRLIILDWEIKTTELHSIKPFVQYLHEANIRCTQTYKAQQN